MPNLTDLTPDGYQAILTQARSMAPGIALMTYDMQTQLPEGLWFKLPNQYIILTNWGFGSASSNNDCFPYKIPPPSPDMEVAALNPTTGRFEPLPCLIRVMESEHPACDGEHTERSYALHCVTPVRLAHIIMIVSALPDLWMGVSCPADVTAV